MKAQNMNFIRYWVVLAVLFGATVVLNAEESHQIPESLRGGITADRATVETAIAMQQQGWVYVMPSPKSSKATWGNTDGRTTWWVGYWKNEKTKLTSANTPKLIEGKYVGDGNGSRYWRRGGSPVSPSKLEWLLSAGGGVKPRNG